MIGGIQYEGTEHEIETQQSIFTHRGTDRILKYAFDLALLRAARHLSSATKSNGIIYSMLFGDKRVKEMSKSYLDVTFDQHHINIFTANFVCIPEHYDIDVASSLLVDLLSDLGPVCTGTIAIAPSANINPTHEFPSMF